MTFCKADFKLNVKFQIEFEIWCVMKNAIKNQIDLNNYHNVNITIENKMRIKKIKKLN